jgi:hypothetical protein
MVHCPLMRTELESENGLNCASASFIYEHGNQPQGEYPGCNLEKRTEYSCILRSTDETGWFGWYHGWGDMTLAGW